MGITGSRPEGRLQAFDGLRACAAGSVVIFHVSQACALTGVGTLAAVLSGLKVGVTLFFVLSGFLLYLPYARALRCGAPLPGLAGYARRRAVRILPAYWVALAILGTGSLAAGVTAANWWRYFLLLQVYHSSSVVNTGVGGAWSLCVEISFYALLPVLAWLMARLGRGRPPARMALLQLAVLALVAVDCLAFRLSLTGSMSYMVSTGHLVAATSLPGLLDWFCIGMALAVLAADWEAGGRVLRPVAWLSTRPALCLLLAAGCYAAVLSTHPGNPFLSQYSLVDHVALGATAGFLVLAATGTVHPGRLGLTIRLLGSRPMVWLGEASYGIYLWHLAVLWALTGRSGFAHPQGVLTYAEVLVAVLVIAVALGAASMYLVERPAQRLLSRPRRPAVAVARAEA